MIEAPPNVAAVATAVQSANSALPQWLREVLPKWWLDRPAFTEMAWAIIVAFSHEFGASALMFYAAADTIGADKWPLILTYAQHFNWIPVIASAIFPALRGRTAFVKAKVSPP